MKVICSKTDLNTNLSLVSRVVPSRPTHPVLGNVLLVANAEEGRIYLTAFDLALGIRASFPAEVIEGGSIALPAKILNDIVSRLKDGEITISHLEEEEGEENVLVTVTAASFTFTLNSMKGSDFPELPQVDGNSVSLPVLTLSEGLRRSVFAASADETKQILTGVHLRSSANSLEFAATDGHRLAVVQTYAEEEAAEMPEFSVTIPVRALRELEKMLSLGQPSDSVNLTFDNTQVVFELGSQRLTSRLLEGIYPAYDRLIPQEFSRQISLDRKRLLNSLELVSVIADAKNNLVKFSLDNQQSQVCLSVETRDVGSAKEYIPCSMIGDAIEIGFNIKYLMDGIKSLPTNEIQMQLNESDRPVIFTPIGGGKMIYLVMPLQLK